MNILKNIIIFMFCVNSIFNSVWIFYMWESEDLNIYYINRLFDDVNDIEDQLEYLQK